MQLNWSRRSLGGGGGEKGGGKRGWKGENSGKCLFPGKSIICVPLGCLIAEKKCFKQKICMANFLSFYHEPRAFWTAYLAACLLIQNEHCCFPSRPRLFTKGEGYWAGKGGERGFYKLDALALYLRLLNNTPSRYWLAPSPILFVIFCSFV